MPSEMVMFGNSVWRIEATHKQSCDRCSAKALTLEKVGELYVCPPCKVLVVGQLQLVST